MTWRRACCATIVLALALALPAVASGGGFSTVGLDRLPERLVPGQTWSPTFTILQHGRSPAAGLRPTLTLLGPGGRSETFEARPTRRPGEYRARVKVPSAGRWTASVDHGWGVQHRFGPIEVAGGAQATPTRASGSTPVNPSGRNRPTSEVAWVVALAAGALGALATALVRRRVTATP